MLQEALQEGDAHHDKSEMLPTGEVCHTGDGIFSLGLVVNQNFRESGKWGIWQEETGSVDCLPRTIRREQEYRCTEAVRGMWLGQEKGIPFCLILLVFFFLLPFFFFFF